ncbi:MAG: hypothetical protein UU81_C0027G0005 [Microgenomates group bacterium GW2011_GWC1_41_8]|uniref:DUF948 domain-containing protein n=2 Tax=Candidatus Roizmaniibacteriota TaxID=1752723 RepID=A0A0G0TCE3_9BACT|nr:MAG: hypothetical protein UT85_C0005G0036 [Candidatus Levybacteria bacterium GW2011_GWA2_40_16]KKR72501.1 MAG: hypothetical protein UU14_C0005G0069 [Candidatus Roizmanbacteria bacterium GW2011_GWB1_40_7]KKR94028.1 MAG: hypothetical protein UU41_C0014G0006 [Candidatus Roizmanbacteria bacterium GW2011_GWA1_41_13]KKS23496.1 MAG: hypothetical protein UU81_C0027G0005 [Microgenomates group bacterium GW2011_GWC1_41_8]OGK50460.1 MAG: hypothetical protein A3A55_00770 [Candidatus Roizmanbacteria bacte
MTQTTQIIIVSVITVLTVVLSLVGFQAFLLLKELRESIKRTNKILDDVDNVTTKLSNSTDSLTGMFEGLRAVVGLVGAFKKGIGKNGSD